MPKRALNDRIVKTLKPAKAGRRYEIGDTILRGFGVRVTDKGRRTFVLVTRYPGSPNPTRRAIGDCGAISLEKARHKARAWLELIKQNIDPAEQEERERLAQQQKRKNSFAAVVEDFIAEKLSGERKGREAERDIRKLVEFWGDLPITDITDLHVIGEIKNKKRTAPVAARNMLALVKRFFNWAIDQRVYGLTASPCAQLKPGRLIGGKKRRDRTLTDDELFALWRAAKRMSYPAGSVYRLLVLSALRLNEAAGAASGEFDPEITRLRNQTANTADLVDALRRLPDERKVWVIPAERMKGKNETAQAHAVPLTDDMLAALAELPRFKRGEHLFTTTFGAKPAWIGDKIKKDLDARMLRTLKALARRRSEEPASVELKPWVNHDIRRTVRTHLSRLRIAEEAREAVMAHVRPGIKGTYDLHDYLDEKREALTLWAGRLRSIVEPQPDNVVPLKQSA